MRLVDLTTKPWQLMLPGEKETSLNKMVYLPGTLDEFGVGHEDRLDNSCHPDETTAQSFDDDVIATRFTRKHTYEGPAYFEQEITIAPADKCRTFFEIERARCVRVYLDGEEISSYEEQTISTPHVFELTGLRMKIVEITVSSQLYRRKKPLVYIIISSFFSYKA